MDITDLIFQFGYWVDLLTGILAALALLAFFWGLVKYIFAAGNAESKADGKKIMVWGAVALFVLFSIFGIIRFLQRSFGVGGAPGLPPPRVNVGDYDDNPCNDPNPPAPCL